MPKPVGGSQVLQATFEKLQDQSHDVASGLKDLVAGAAGSDTKGDNGVEQLAGKPDPPPGAQPVQSPGGTSQPLQLVEKRKKEQRQIEFYRRQVGEWDKHYQQLRQEAAARQRQEEEVAKQQPEQEIAQLQAEQAKAETLQGPAKPKPGRGTAFLPQQAKQSRGTGELSKSPAN